jgi:hypothetical protein
MLPEYIAHYPDRRLPAILVEDHADPARGVTVYRVVDPGAPAGTQVPKPALRPDLP